MYANYLKRPFDIVFSLVALILLSWLFVAVILVYVISWQLPIFFKQERTGGMGEPFMMFKFRTLKQEASGDRRFWWGDVLRFLSIDELPQLWNVLKGDMSLVGPRPLLTEYLPLYSAEQKRRLDVRPGVTGWAQVNGRHSISWPEKFNLDLYYVKNVSLKLDVLILIKTIFLLFSFRKDVSLLEEKFKGN